MKSLTLGLLPAAGGSLIDLASTGQLERLINHYLPAYLKIFETLFYFSYQQESLSDHISDPVILNQVTVIPKLNSLPYRLYAFQLPFIAKQHLRRCHVLRVFQATGAAPAILAGQLYGIPYVTTYGYKYHAFAAVEGRWFNSFYLRLLEPLALRLSAGVITTTQELATYAERFVPTSKIHLIPNGVDTAYFRPLKDHPKPNGNKQKTILFVGRLTPQKNLTRLLEALSILSKRHALRLQIIGAGPLKSELANTAERLNVECAFEGIVPYQVLPNYMNQADVFVLPSLIEGHPKVLLEAMSCSLACVASNCQGNRVMLEHEKTGLLFDPTDVQQLAQSIERVITTPALAAQLGQAARHYVCARYNLNQLLEQETALLKAIGEGRV